jgi:hypothetical protein
VYHVFAERLPELPLWWDIAFIAVVLIPATFALVWLCLPLRRSRYLLLIGVAAGGSAALLDWQGADIAGDFAKLAAITALAWFFLRFFEEVSWILLVALVIIPIDIYSVARGPTKVIIEERPDLFDHFSVTFPVPGEAATAQLGLPDVLFFALFLGAADRFGLRVPATWILCTASFGLTLVIAAGTDVSGLPALPLLSVAFVLANADLFWKQIRRQPA